MTRPVQKIDTKGIAEVLATGMKLKSVMNKKGLKRARCVCPRCGGTIRATLAGARNHLHMACDGGCGMQMME
ncbi:hypothetical protein [Shinella pollutisoli]|uniref:Uncharacterized protein n=1 Tax=Shinella pollutisoli TaxID=2250594 RepID=A0ABV7DI93_9HYPH|nr:hypothetical protein [Shinella pollutisoli]